MKLPAAVAGATAGPLIQDIDARWLMAYAAGLGDIAPDYLDTLRPGGILAHPVFPVCYEWPLVLALRARAIPEALATRSVHATHDLVIHRPPRPGDRLRSTARVQDVEARAPGAYVLVRVETVDAAGAPVTTTEYGSLYRGVACEAPAATGGAPPRPAEDLALDAGEPWTADVPVDAGRAHIYTECARIWNPIHTDREVARGAGLPDIILHGTATLALAVSAVLAREGPAAAPRVRRVSCRFGAMVRMPATLTVRARATGEAPAARSIAFEVFAAGPRPALRDGRLVLTRRGDGA